MFVALNGFNYRVCELLAKRGTGIGFRNSKNVDQPALASGRNLIYSSIAMSSVPTDSGFDIAVSEGIFEYVCSFLD